MKLKHVFFSSLLLSTAFVACTNEDIENLQTEAKGALALGEGYTVSVVGGDESRAAFRSDLTPYWQNGDKLGAAWFHQVTEVKANDEVVTAGEIGGADKENRKFYSNHPFLLTKGAGTNNGEFTAPTNAFAGAYVLYYPYDGKFVSTKGELDVKDIPAIQEMDCTTGKELAAVNGNMFVYGVNKLVPGGEQTQEVKINQLPVLYQVKFQFGPELRLALIDPVTITKVILEAEDANGYTVLVTDGTITPNKDASIDRNSYNVPTVDADGKEVANHSLPAAVYSGKAESATDHISVNIKNSNKAAYQIAKLETLTSKPFIFSTLPFIGEARKVTFKIVTSNGLVFAKTYNADDHAAVIESINGTDEYPGATYEGGQVNMNVTLNVQQTDNVIYTAEQFKEAWTIAMKSKNPATIWIGEDIVLDEELTYSQLYKKEVTVAAHCDNHSLTIEGLDVNLGANVIFENPLIVKGDVVTAAKSQLTAENLTAENITANGEAVLTVANAKTLNIVGSGVVTLSQVDEYSRIGEIVVESVSGSNGKLKVENFNISNMTNEGIVEIGGNVTTWGTVNNKAYFELSGNTLINEGTFNEWGEFEGGKFQNNPGATLNFYSGTTDDTTAIENKAETSTEDAGVINIKMSDAGSSAKGNYVRLNTGSSNKGTINVVKGYLAVGTGVADVQTEESGVINVSKNATFDSKTNAVTAGRVVMLDVASVIKNVVNDCVYFPVDGNTVWSTVPADEVALNLIVAGTVDVKTAGNVLKVHKLSLENATLRVSEDFEMGHNRSITVYGNSAIVNPNNGNDLVDFSLKGNNIVTSGAKLTLNKIDLVNADGATLVSKGSIDALNGSQYNVNSSSAAY